ncbi:hypothetical protein [Actinoplanes solisilvae]|uniref:hypothetical protein n=1 Tax=Actinoplanes solisilvae TaxID=2486853 RepID=UPI000FDCC665|nr:hypothetical protein [Actinoplanes solisilvae]
MFNVARPGTPGELRVPTAPVTVDDLLVALISVDLGGRSVGRSGFWAEPVSDGGRPSALHLIGDVVGCTR